MTAIAVERFALALYDPLVWHGITAFFSCVFILCAGCVAQTLYEMR